MNQKSNPSGLGTDFGTYVPGFDFLQKLVHGDPQALYASWIAPTLDLKVLDQRIGELKAVLFWLEQNTAALKATLQALELQKMTLAALRSMGSPMPGAVPTSDDRSAAPGASASGTSAAFASAGAQAEPGAAPPFMADAMQYWGALTQQFQTIATQAMQEVAARNAASAAANANANVDAAAGPKPASAADGAASPASPAANPAKRAAEPTGAQPRRGAKPKPDLPEPNA